MRTEESRLVGTGDHFLTVTTQTESHPNVLCTITWRLHKLGQTVEPKVNERRLVTVLMEVFDKECMSGKAIGYASSSIHGVNGHMVLIGIEAADWLHKNLPILVQEALIAKENDNI